MSDRELILVVDDNDSGRFIRSETLRRAGFRVTEAATGYEALEQIATEPPAVALLDVNLPDISGLEVCRRIKAGTTVPPIQVLQISETAISDADRVRGLNQGADVYLVEPVGSSVLVATVKALLRASQAERQAAVALQRESEARAEAEHANRMKDEFLAMVSHELRTPLNTMTGWIWHLRHASMDEAARTHAVEVLDRNVRIQLQLINDLLDVSRFAAGKLQVDLRMMDLSVVVAAAAEAVLAQSAHRDKKIQFAIQTEPVFVLGDTNRLQQVVSNVLNNAVQFTPNGGHVSVRSGPLNGQAVMQVTDSGVGIDPAFLPHVFERFRQAKSPASAAYRGLGLGLAIVDHLVHLHHGTVSLESAGIGHGTTCTISLPLVEARTGDAAGGRSEPLPPLTGLRVLVVEDDADAREVLTSMLTVSGAAIVAVETGEEGLEQVRTVSFDAIVSDVKLPGMSGSEMMRAIRNSGYSMPALALTAFATMQDRQALLADGFQEHFAKPVDPGGLLAFLERVARIRQHPSP